MKYQINKSFFFVRMIIKVGSRFVKLNSSTGPSHSNYRFDQSSTPYISSPIEILFRVICDIGNVVNL